MIPFEPSDSVLAAAIPLPTHHALIGGYRSRREGKDRRDRALFDLPIASNLRGRDLVKLCIGVLVSGRTLFIVKYLDVKIYISM
ncbi:MULTISPECIES: hypothetical protein [unclassified Novosphingobium]|uniref:hypothetical protein n=1 Tax=unclassified Novosphingobium TaxID=2644732 RepID=UPI00086BF0DD|nr:MULTISPECIES: hypothetical protein [unclassified Novosphingobium]MBN9144661.1 hypothetical protein [Novosphingobium sp.]MDR6708295.1 hypothetical protein [Novosphingobium sp. 1748]ODU77859.1 MAG: hypothetical protein ABT10_23890 [Novosphingobium sp. SCN 63-17]OJX92075.1 MAG: hypothetical protein BGP00_07260 [Novosphingobium sp. 63-713]